MKALYAAVQAAQEHLNGAKIAETAIIADSALLGQLVQRSRVLNRIHFAPTDAPGAQGFDVFFLQQGELKENAVFGSKEGNDVLVAAELFEYEIGQPLEARALPMRISVLLGAREVLFLTEMFGFGGEDRKITSGNLLLATDHYIFSGVTPVVGPHV